MDSLPPALPDLGAVPALPPFQEASEEHPIEQEGAELDSWIIEGTDNLDDAGIRHKNAFYALLKEWFRGRDYTCTLLTKRKYEEILKFCLDLINGADCCTLYIAGNKQAYKWAAKYDAIVVGEESAVLVLHLTKGPIADAQSTCLSALQQPTYFERLFLDLLKIHCVDHCKGNTFWKRAKRAHDNVPRELCKMFSDCCSQCITVIQAKKPVAGIKNIVTEGFGVRGQVDMIDFQSMPDGKFIFLMNYIDHGIKKLTATPLVAKRATGVAVALLNIFTEQGPPSILQADNGGEFSGSATDHVGRRMLLDDEFIDAVISKIKQFWPECQLVRGSPRHSESNGGVERVNQTIQKKLGAWMKENKSTQWSIGCKIAQWRYNTQVHHTLRDSPYHLTFGQHPRVGISNLPIASEILQNLVTEADLNDVYSNMTCGMIADASTQPLDPSVQDVITTVAKAVENGTTDVNTTPDTTGATSSSRRPSSYNASQFKRQTKRLKSSALGNAVVGNRKEKAGAPDDITPAKKGTTGKSCDMDLSSVCWMQLINERDPTQKPVTLPELKKARIGSVFPIVRCINNKDITDPENWESCILKKVQKELWEVLNVHQNEKVEDDLDYDGDDGLKNTWGLYYKNVGDGDEYVTSFITNTERDLFNADIHEVSPKRSSLRAKATANVQKKADAVTKKALTKSPTSSLKLGDVVLVPLNDVD